ncbi:hypothetical protein A3F03_03680 [Candidatus Roizmanbacteria bacterium RIFCSPHIGHO2_12_FULL_41_11]|uniref:DUF3324 domain-containing protein n=1 Tax=Candidatus Roizmanbacteria bacterium RIFCSPHIGHO2_12_FULL_41_11 TaxID=1802052 RepID=A0A1F7I574_9BACT|nr:MAG: hypothetical protein A3F03_03680 [Candidatus Roizmanbacteria bacterium RIFCSPHIGHO2_12_FULL_41_11]
MIKKNIIKIGIALVLLITFTKTGFAASPNTNLLTVEPAYQDVVLNYFEKQKQLTYTITNNTTKKVILKAYAVDVKQNDFTGSIEFIQKDANNPYSLVTYLEVVDPDFELMPKEKYSLVVNVKNDDNLSPGGHYGAVLIQVSSPSEANPVVLPSLAVQIFLRKEGGDKPGLLLESVGWPNRLVWDIPASISLRFANIGNIHLTPYGRIEIRDQFSRLTYVGIVNESSLIIFPKTKRDIIATFRQTSWLLPFSLNVITIQGDELLHKVNYSYQRRFVYINLYAALALMAIIIFAVIKRKLLVSKAREIMQVLKPKRVTR